MGRVRLYTLLINAKVLNIIVGTHIFREYPDVDAGCTNLHGNPGFLAEYFMSYEAKGKPFHVEEHPRGRFTTLVDTAVTGCKTVLFTSTYHPPIAGKHYLSFSGLGPSKFFINDVLAVEQKGPAGNALGFLLGVQEEIHFQYAFSTSRDYKIVIETHPSPYSNSELYLMDNQFSVHLGLISQSEMEQGVLAEAVELAKDADLAILFVGNNTQWETEGQDLSSMTLPADGSQDKLIESVAAVNKNVVVNTTGVPVELPWLDNVSEFLQT